MIRRKNWTNATMTYHHTIYSFSGGATILNRTNITMPVVKVIPLTFILDIGQNPVGEKQAT